MPSTQVSAKTFLKFSAAFALALLLIPAAFAADHEGSTGLLQIYNRAGLGAARPVAGAECGCGSDPAQHRLAHAVGMGSLRQPLQYEEGGTDHECGAQELRALQRVYFSPTGYPICPADPGEAGAGTPIGADTTRVGKPGRAPRHHDKNAGGAEHDTAHGLRIANHEDQAGRGSSRHAIEDCRSLHAALE